MLHRSNMGAGPLLRETRSRGRDYTLRQRVRDSFSGGRCGGFCYAHRHKALLATTGRRFSRQPVASSSEPRQRRHCGLGAGGRRKGGQMSYCDVARRGDVVAIVCGAVLLAAAPASAQRKEPPPSREAAQYSFAPIVKKAAPAVVNVYVRARVATFVSPFADDPLFRRFFGDRFGMPQERIQNSLGSGVIVSPDGIVVTNTHVVKIGGAAEIRIALADRREFDAKVIQLDEKSDIAVLQDRGRRRPLSPSGVRELRRRRGGRSGAGDRQPVRRRPDRDQRHHLGAGAHGGGALGGAGVHPDRRRHQPRQLRAARWSTWPARVVGINTAIFSRSGGSHGVGFAIPSNMVKLIVDSAVAGRKLERPWLGAKLDTMTREMAEAMGLDRVAGAHRRAALRRGPGGGGRAAGRRRHRCRRRPRGRRCARHPVPADHARRRQQLPSRYRAQGPPAFRRRGAARGPAGRQGRRAQSVGCASLRRCARRQHPARHRRRARDRGSGGRRHPVRCGPNSKAARIGFQPGDVIQQVGRTKIETVQRAGGRAEGAPAGVAGGRQARQPDRAAAAGGLTVIPAQGRGSMQPRPMHGSAACRGFGLHKGLTPFATRPEL